ncbi:hypothetical protein KKG83_00250 [Candidatus Micrarchaeota archaeon]|nr:hypothetical protein [Candidatus Micrarchaeota archaeon]
MGNFNPPIRKKDLKKSFTKYFGTHKDKIILFGFLLFAISFVFGGLMPIEFVLVIERLSIVILTIAGLTDYVNSNDKT